MTTNINYEEDLKAKRLDKYFTCEFYKLAEQFILSNTLTKLVYKAVSKE